MVRRPLGHPLWGPYQGSLGFSRRRLGWEPPHSCLLQKERRVLLAVVRGRGQILRLALGDPMTSNHISIYADSSDIFILSPDCSQYGHPMDNSNLTHYLYSTILPFPPCPPCQEMAHNPPSYSVQNPGSYPYSSLSLVFYIW